MKKLLATTIMGSLLASSAFAKDFDEKTGEYLGDHGALECSVYHETTKDWKDQLNDHFYGAVVLNGGNGLLTPEVWAEVFGAAGATPEAIDFLNDIPEGGIQETWQGSALEFLLAIADITYEDLLEVMQEDYPHLLTQPDAPDFALPDFQAECHEVGPVVEPWEKDDYVPFNKADFDYVTEQDVEQFYLAIEGDGIDALESDWQTWREGGSVEQAQNFIPLMHYLTDIFNAIEEVGLDDDYLDEISRFVAIQQDLRQAGVDI